MTEVSLMPPHGQPPGPASPTAQPPLTLAEEHVLLLWQVTASAEELLTAAEHGRWPGAELAALAGYAEAEVLRLGGHPHEWYPLTEGPEVDLDVLPAGQAVPAATDRLLRMRRGEQVEFQWSTDLNLVWREMNKLSPGGYRFAVLQDGPVRWRMRVTRRQAVG
jgi:hypothetical protein